MTARSRANPKESLARTAAMLDAQIEREFANLMRSLDYQTKSMRMIEARISIINQKLMKRGETVVRLRELVEAIDIAENGTKEDRKFEQAGDTQILILPPGETE